MHRGKHQRRISSATANRGGQSSSWLLSDLELTAEEGLGGRRPEAHHHLRANQVQLRFQPWTAGGLLSDVGLLVDAGLAPLGEL